MNKIEKTKVSALILLCIIATVIITVAAQTPTSTFTLSPGLYPSGPSYTVWREGSNYFAKDHNGLLAYSGTNASDLIIDCISNQGWTHLTKGTYELTNAILIDTSNVTVTGEGSETVLYIQNNALCNAFTISGASNVIVKDIFINGNNANNAIVTGGTNATICVTNYSEDIRLENLMIYNGSDGIKSRYSNNVIVDACTIKYCDYVGVVSSGYSNNTVVTNCVLDSNSWGGVEMCGGYHYGLIVDSNHIIGMNATKQRGVVIGNGANITISNNVFSAKKVTNSFCIVIECVDSWSGSSNGEYTTVTGNIMFGGSHGIYVNYKKTFQPRYIVIADNVISNYTNNGVWLNGTDNIIVSNNIMYSGTTGIYLTETQNTVVTNNLCFSGSYGIRETNTNNNNLFVANIAHTNTVANITIAGTDSECHSCFNGTTWVT